MRVKEIIPLYIKYLKALGRAFYTIKGIKAGLRDFIRFLEQERLYFVEDLTKDLLRDYQQDLAFRLTKKGRPLEILSQAQLLMTVRGFTRFLKDEDYLLSDPGEAITIPKLPKRLPRVILSPGEVGKLMKAPDMRTNRGYRNRVILEILYETAIRRSEVSSIRLGDLDLDAGYIRIKGKGGKERVVPLSKRACDLIRSYIHMVRPSFRNGKDTGYLILNRWGERMEPNSVWAVVKKCVHEAGIKKRVSTHTFRHTCATHMLRNGAPVRHLQEMLGHESLQSTQIYTRVTINDLKEIHAKYHPSESMGGA